MGRELRYVPALYAVDARKAEARPALHGLVEDDSERVVVGALVGGDELRVDVFGKDEEVERVGQIEERVARHYGRVGQQRVGRQRAVAEGRGGRAGHEGVGQRPVFERGADGLHVPGYLLAGLVEDEVAVGVVEAVDAIFGVGRDVLDAEASRSVGLGYAHGHRAGEGGVVQTLVEQRIHALHGLERGGVVHESGNHHRVGALAGREGEGVVAQHVALVEVGYAVGKVERVGGAGLQVALELDGDGVGVRVDAGRGYHGRRDHELGHGVLELDILVELKDDLGAAEPHGVGRRSRPDEDGRFDVARAAGGRARVGALPQPDAGCRCRKCGKICLFQL